MSVLPQPARPAPAVAVRELARLREELAAVKALQESYLDNRFWWQNADPYETRFEFGGSGSLYPYADRSQDRTHAPLPYLTEPEWRASLALVRDMAQRNHILQGFCDHLCAFVGSVSVQFVRRGEVPGPVAAATDSWVKAATGAWEETCEVNEWGTGETDRETECRRRVSLEGDTTLKFFRGDRYEVPKMRHVEPELIRSPNVVPDDFPWATTNDWKWGKLTKPSDAETVLALWESHPDGTDGCVIPANRFVTSKVNVDRCVKRGMSDFFACTELLTKTKGLLEAMAHVARLQAKIAWWEQFLTATEAQIRAMTEASRNTIVPGSTYNAYAGASAQRDTDVKDYPTGAVIRTDVREVKPGPTATPDGFLAIEQAVMRSIGFRFGLPDSFTGDANSFAAALTKGSLLVNFIEERQKKNRGFVHNVVMMSLALCEESGRVPPGTCRAVKPVLTSKQIEIADEEKKARKFLALYAAKCASPQKYIESEGHDPKEVAADILAWNKIFPQPAQAPQPRPALDPTPAPPGSAGGDQSSPNDNPMNEGRVAENFTGTDAHGHHWVNGKQVKAPDESPTASAHVSIPGHDAARAKLPAPEAVTALPKTKKTRDELAKAVKGAWNEARNALAVKYGTRDINDRMSTEENAAEHAIFATLQTLASGNEYSGPRNLGPVSDVKYADTYQSAVQALDRLRALAAQKPATESRVAEEHGPAPYPGAVFDPVAHRWKNPHTGEEHPTEPAAPDPVEAKSRTLAARIKEVPAELAGRVVSWVHAKYTKLSARYGATGAKAVLGAMILLAPTPVPGSSLIPIAVAEAVLRLKKALTGEATERQLSDAEVRALALDLLHELYESEGATFTPEV